MTFRQIVSKGDNLELVSSVTLSIPPLSTSSSGLLARAPSLADWLNVVWQGIPQQTKANITAADSWLNAMANAAENLGLEIQVSFLVATSCCALYLETQES